jgi:transposase
MSDRSRPDPKRDALRERGLLNRAPEDVTDEAFQKSDFFDPRDLLQVKYEMIRRVEVEGAAIARAADAFGFSRPSFYEAQRAFSEGGLPALLPKKRGPQDAHKLGPKVMDFIEQERARDSAISTTTLVRLVKERFGIEVHRRSIERALARRGKKPL